MYNLNEKIDKLSLGVTQWALRHAVLVIIFSVLSVIGIAAGGQYLVFSGDYRIFFSEKNPELDAFETLQDTYTKSDNILFVIEPADGNVFSQENIEKIARLTEQAWQIPFATRVDSLTNFQHTTSRGDTLIVEDMFPSPSELSSAQTNMLSKDALQEPLLLNNLVTESGKATAINVTLAYPQKSETEVPKSVEAARIMRDKYLSMNPDDQIYLTGVSMLNNAFTEAGFADLGSLIPMMFVLILLVTYLILRSFYATSIIFIIVFLSSMLAMGVAGYAGVKLSPISSVAPVIILTIAVADAIHILMSLRKFLATGKSKSDAIIESLRLNYLPVIITSITTIVGFLALNLSDSPPFWHLGNITALGIAAAGIFSLILLPAIASLMPLERWKTNPSQLHSNTLENLANLIIEKPKSIVILVLVVTFGFISYIPNIQLNDQWTKYFDNRIQFRRDTDKALDHFGLYPIEYSVPAKGPGGINTPEYLKKIDEFTNFLRTQKNVKHVYAFSDIMKRINKNLNYGNDEFYRIPENKNLSAQSLLLYEMSLPYGLDLNDRVNIDKSATRVTATLGNVSTEQTKVFLSNVDDWINNNFPDYMANTKPTSAQVMFTYIAKRNVDNMLLGTIIAIIAISIVIIFAFGSIRLGLLSLIPNALPILVTFGLWAIFIGEIGFSVAAVATISLGIVVDDTVHFISKYTQARREKGLDAASSIHYMFQTVGMSIFVNTLVLIVGFLLLIYSAFKINVDMGLFTSMTIAIALLLDFLLLPAIILLFDGNRDSI